MNRDVRELFKLYEQTVSIGNTQLQNPQPSVSVGGMQLRNDPYNIQVPQTPQTYAPAGVTPTMYFDYEGAKKDWRAFQEKNFVAALFIQVLDPTSITSIPDIEDSYNWWAEEKDNSTKKTFKFAWFLFNVFAAIPLWVPIGGQIGKYLNIAKGTAKGARVAVTGGKLAPKVAPKVLVGSLDLIFSVIKNPAVKKFIAGVMERIGKDPKAIEAVMKTIDSSDPVQLAKLVAEQLGVSGDEFTKALDAVKAEGEQAKRLASRESINAAKDVALRLGADPKFIDVTEQGLVAKIKYWLGTTGKGSTVEDAIEYLKKGDYSDLPENIRNPFLNDILKTYGIKESQLADYARLIWGDASTAAAEKGVAKAAGETAEVATKAGAADVAVAGTREIDKIAAENAETIELLNRTDLPRNIQSTIDKVNAKGGAILKSALQKIANRNSAEVVAKAGGRSTAAVLSRAERQALEKAAKALEEGGILRFVGKVAGKTARVAGKAILLKSFIALKAAAALQYWLKRQYEKGKAYKPTEPKRIQVTGLPRGYIPQGSTASTPQGRNVPNAQTIYPPTNTANQYQYKPVKWWSTQ